MNCIYIVGELEVSAVELITFIFRKIAYNRQHFLQQAILSMQSICLLY